MTYTDPVKFSSTNNFVQPMTFWHYHSYLHRFVLRPAIVLVTVFVAVFVLIVPTAWTVATHKMIGRTEGGQHRFYVDHVRPSFTHGYVYEGTWLGNWERVEHGNGSYSEYRGPSFPGACSVWDMTVSKE